VDRREFLIRTATVSLAVTEPVPARRQSVAGPTNAGGVRHMPHIGGREHRASRGPVTLFLGGDVMTGRGIDQVLPHPASPELFEPFVRSATQYVELAEAVNGPIARPVDFSYVWGDALRELDRVAPGARIVNLETSVTTSDDHWRDKEIHYRMHPQNVPCLAAAMIDCCVLANNHVLDWGTAGLEETLETLRGAGIKTAGAGGDREDAAAPALLDVGAGRRVVVFAFGAASSGIPRRWRATGTRAGVHLLPDLSANTVRDLAARVHTVRRDGDVVVASIHWGSNWGYEVSRQQRAFARGLIDAAGVDVVHGHSSHHPKGIEVYRGRPILYGCGDLLNDYEGIAGYEAFRDDLVLMYFPTMDAAGGGLVRFELSPMRMRRFRLNHASKDEAAWLRDALTREGETLGTQVESHRDDALRLRW
jgi:poly-gamma-glutamate capsule biosynthesis protein CapA/YwtB (metallophosphatase superfamily)